MTFDRELALRVRNCELAGLGHPLVDAVIEEFKQPALPGNVSGAGGGSRICAHYLVLHRNAMGQLQVKTFNFLCDAQTGQVQILKRFEFVQIKDVKEGKADFSKVREGIEAVLQHAIIEWLPDRQAKAGLQISLLGLYRCLAS